MPPCTRSYRSPGTPHNLQSYFFIPLRKDFSPVFLKYASKVMNNGRWKARKNACSATRQMPCRSMSAFFGRFANGFSGGGKYVWHISNYVRHILNYLRDIFYLLPCGINGVKISFQFSVTKNANFNGNLFTLSPQINRRRRWEWKRPRHCVRMPAGA